MKVVQYVHGDMQLCSIAYTGGMPVNSQFWDLLARKQAREKRAISLRQVSRDTGVAMSTITALANDSWRALYREPLESLCKYFECDVGDLVRYNAPNEEQPA